MKTLFSWLILLVSSVTLAQEPRGAVEGQVRSTTGTALAGMRVAAMAVPESEDSAPSSVMATIVQTDALGHYRLEDIPPGRYYIVAGLADYPIFYPGVTARAKATVISITGKSTVSSLDITMPPNSQGRTIRGRLTTFAGPQFVNVSALETVFLSVDNATYKMTLANPDGTFEFRQVPPGTYRVRWGSTTLGTNAVVSENDVDVEIVVPCVLHGQIAIENGTGPLLSSMTVLAKGARTELRLHVADTGRFQLTVTDEAYRFSIPNLARGYVIKSARYGVIDLLKEPLKLDSSTLADNIQITLAYLPPNEP